HGAARRSRSRGGAQAARSRPHADDGCGPPLRGHREPGDGRRHHGPLRAPLAHEDHAVRACYAALRMQDAVRRYSDELRRAQGVEMQIRVGLNSGAVVVRSIGSDLRMDYSAVGQTTNLAARMEQLAAPGSVRLTAETLHL